MSENAPLITRRSSSNKTDRILRKNARKTKQRNCVLLTVTILLLGGVFVIMVFFKNASDPKNSKYNNNASSSILGRARDAKAMVQIDSDTGVYSVDWDGDGIGDEEYATKIDSATTTFAELAETILLPWYEASIIAIVDDKAWESGGTGGGILPSNVQHIRRVMLITRDMLDIFSPVFPDSDRVGKKRKDKSLWKELRTMYRHGYQKLGSLKDLEDLTYSQELLASRVNDVLAWKTEFLAFQKTYGIRRFLYSPHKKGGGIDPNGCYNHAASHLFWAVTAQEELPCGNDIGTASLRSLATVQLTNSLHYLEEIRNYTTVMPRAHELNFHNLRKELRIFLDEYDLFGKLLVPPSSDEEDGNGNGNGNGTVWAASTTDDSDTIDGSSAEEKKVDVLVDDLAILNMAQKKLGEINDKWTAHDIYVKDDSHLKKQKSLAIEADKKWAKFLKWQSQNDLQGCIETVLDRMK